MHLNWSSLILIAAGIYALLGAFRVVKLSKNLQANELWLQKFGPMMKIVSPITILFGIGQLFGLFR
jgi:hypothetical protein